MAQPAGFKPGVHKPKWIDDSLVNECSKCRVSFGFFTRKHHCRRCGKIFCNSCSDHNIPIPSMQQFYGNQPQRICDTCFHEVRQEIHRNKIAQSNQQNMRIGGMTSGKIPSSSSYTASGRTTAANRRPVASAPQLNQNTRSNARSKSADQNKPKTADNDSQDSVQLFHQPKLRKPSTANMVIGRSQPDKKNQKKAVKPPSPLRSGRELFIGATFDAKQAKEQQELKKIQQEKERKLKLQKEKEMQQRKLQQQKQRANKGPITGDEKRRREPRYMNKTTASVANDIFSGFDSTPKKVVKAKPKSKKPPQNSSAIVNDIFAVPSTVKKQPQRKPQVTQQKPTKVQQPQATPKQPTTQPNAQKPQPIDQSLVGRKPSFSIYDNPIELSPQQQQAQQPQQLPPQPVEQQQQPPQQVDQQPPSNQPVVSQPPPETSYDPYAITVDTNVEWPTATGEKIIHHPPEHATSAPVISNTNTVNTTDDWGSVATSAVSQQSDWGAVATSAYDAPTTTYNSYDNTTSATDNSYNNYDNTSTNYNNIDNYNEAGGTIEQQINTYPTQNTADISNDTNEVQDSSNNAAPQQQQQQQEGEPVPPRDSGLGDTPMRRKIQSKLFIRWINRELENSYNGGGVILMDLAKDFSNGVALVDLAETLTRTTAPTPVNFMPSTAADKQKNVQLALQIFSTAQRYIPSFSIDAFVNGDISTMLDVCWAIVYRYDIEPKYYNEGSGIMAVLAWVMSIAPTYNLNIYNFNSCFSDGLVFCAVLDYFVPNYVDFNSLQIDQKEANLRTAFDGIQSQLRVPQLLDVEDTATEPDDVSIICYLACLHTATSYNTGY